MKISGDVLWVPRSGERPECAHPSGQDHKEARRRGENGLWAVKEQYNWEKEPEKLLALYKEVINK